MHRRVPLRGVPLPDGPSLRSLADASGPSLGTSPSGAHGVLYSSQVCSRTRVIGHL